MKVSRYLLAAAPFATMMAVVFGTRDAKSWLAGLATNDTARSILVQIEATLAGAAAAIVGLIFLFAAKGTTDIKAAGFGVAMASAAVILLGMPSEMTRLLVHAQPVAAGSNFVSHSGLVAIAGAGFVFCVGLFGLRVGIKGNSAFPRAVPRRIHGKRAVYGEAEWMCMNQAQRIFPDTGGIVVGERYRVDCDSVSALMFRSDKKQSWGAGGASQLLCFDGSFGSSHGIVFAGSGGFKTSSVTIPTALKWGGGLVVLDPSLEVAPMVFDHRRKAGRNVIVLDPADAGIGFNALDWIGRFGSTKEEDIVSVATWVMTDNARQLSARDDFFRASALQLLTALIADVCLSGHTRHDDQTLRQVRANLSEPEPKLRERLTQIHQQSKSAFVKENVAVFVNMTAETFSGVYANAVKETHWLSYPSYAALVSGGAFSTDDLANGSTDLFIALDLKVLSAHPGLARVIIGALMNAVYNRTGAPQKTLFLLDEVARLGYLSILETARDAGRKYGLALIMIFQSIGQMREAYGGRDATSKWFESASWISFSAINDPDTADYISRRCGDTTIEVDQVSRTTQTSGSSRSSSKQLSGRRLILADEVMRMRADEQIVFTAGNPPLRCGRAIWFRRNDMIACVGTNKFDLKGPNA